MQLATVTVVTVLAGLCIIKQCTIDIGRVYKQLQY